MVKKESTEKKQSKKIEQKTSKPKKLLKKQTKKVTTAKKKVSKKQTTKTSLSSTKKTIKTTTKAKQEPKENTNVYKTAGVFDRYLAKGLDLILISFVAFVISKISIVLALLVALFYALFLDAESINILEVIPGLSLGKATINLRVLDQKTNKAISLRQSAIRNSPIALLVVLSIIPLFGWILMMIVGIPVLVLESYLLYNLEDHNRLGDIIANTKVVEIDPKQYRK